MFLLKYAYQGSEVTFSNGDNVIVNATQMAKAFGKQPHEWLRLPSTKEFLDELTITRKSLNVEYQAVITKKGGQSIIGHPPFTFIVMSNLKSYYATHPNEEVKSLI